MEFEKLKSRIRKILIAFGFFSICMNFVLGQEIPDTIEIFLEEIDLGTEYIINVKYVPNQEMELLTAQFSLNYNFSILQLSENSITNFYFNESVTSSFFTGNNSIVNHAWFDHTTSGVLINDTITAFTINFNRIASGNPCVVISGNTTSIEFIVNPQSEAIIKLPGIIDPRIHSTGDLFYCENECEYLFFNISNLDDDLSYSWILPDNSVLNDSFVQINQIGRFYFEIARQDGCSVRFYSNIIYSPNKCLCNDGIKNNGEEGIDCGGNCIPCNSNGTESVGVNWDNSPKPATLSVNGDVYIDDLIRLKPKSLPPPCEVKNAGTIYFDANLKILRYCDGCNWKDIR